MISAFRRLSLRHFAAHKLRTAITVGGIALGVATILGLRLLHESVTLGYERTVERIAGKAALQVSNGEVGVPEELLDEIRKIPGIAAAAASVQGFVSVPERAGERLYVFGIDLLTDQKLRDIQFRSSQAEVEDPLVFLAQPDSVALTTDFLERNRLALNDKLAVLAPQGRADLTVRGALDVHSGPASLFGGRFAVMDVFAAQRLFRLDGRFSQIDIGISEEAELAQVERAVVVAVGNRGLVERPRARGETLEQLLAANRYGMSVGGMLAIIVGLYLIFNTMMISVVQRRKEIGILRSAGMCRGEVLRWIVSEALVLGAVGSALGVPLGLGMARGMSAVFTTNVSTMYLPVEMPEIPLRLMPVVWGVSLGLLSALVAALAPAREAVGVQPLEALRLSSPRASRPKDYFRAAMAGVFVIAAGAATWFARGILPLGRNASGSIAMLGLIIGTSLAVPVVIRDLAHRLEPLLGRLLGPLGVIAGRNIVRHIGRVAITCSAFLVSLAGAIAIATWLSSFQRTLSLWFESVFSGIDLVVTSGAAPLSEDSTPLPASLAEEIASLPEIERVDAVRTARVTHEGSLTFLIAIDGRLYQQGRRKLILIDGDPRSAVDALARGEAMIVNEAFASRFGVRRGDEISLPTPSGELRLPIVATCFDPTYADVGTIHLDRALYRRLWRDDTVNFIQPVLRRGADRRKVMEEIRHRWGKKHALFVVSIDEFRREADELLNQTISMAYPMIATAITISLLGVVIALLASVLDRMREIGVLRAIGATRAQVVRSVVIESAIIGLMGGILAAAAGSVFGYIQLDILFRGMFGMTVFYRYPMAAVLFALAAAVLLAAVAGYLPGRKAGRLRITEALEYE